MENGPDISFCGLSLWVRQRQFPNASDYWTGNWLTISAKMEAPLASVECRGPILMTADVERFRDGLATMTATLTGCAVLTGLKPGIYVVLKMRSRGHLEGTIEITPDHPNQQHRFKIEADQSYLPALLSSCDAVLRAFPVRNAPKR